MHIYIEVSTYVHINKRTYVYVCMYVCMCAGDLSYVPPSVCIIFHCVYVLRRFFRGLFPASFMLIARGPSLVPAICVNFKA